MQKSFNLIRFSQVTNNDGRSPIAIIFFGKTFFDCRFLWTSKSRFVSLTNFYSYSREKKNNSCSLKFVCRVIICFFVLVGAVGRLSYFSARKHQQAPSIISSGRKQLLSIFKYEYKIQINTQMQFVRVEIVFCKSFYMQNSVKYSIF